MNTRDKILTGLLASVGFIGAIHSGAADSIYGNTDIAGFMRGYQHDITAPFGAYFTMKFFWDKLSPSSSNLTQAAYIFGIYSAGEVAQWLGQYPGTFDPKDFLAYAAGVGMAMIVDKLTFTKKNLDAVIDDLV